MSRPTFLVEPRLITALALDVAKLHAHGSPMEEDLEAAPWLVNWSIGAPTAYGLMGQVSGHPAIADGVVQTSAAYMLASDRTWVRTLSRYYRLGQPLKHWD